MTPDMREIVIKLRDNAIEARDLSILIKNTSDEKEKESLKNKLQETREKFKKLELQYRSIEKGTATKDTEISQNSYYIVGDGIVVNLRQFTNYIN